MTPEDWQRLKVILDGALQREAGERGAYLRQVCVGDAELLARAESLIASAEEAWTGLDGPANRLVESGSGTRIGQRVGAYEVLEEIGHGGMGTVYLGRRADEEFRKRVAIKVVKRGMDTDFVLRRFRTERQILASLEHPNIARLLDGGVTGDGQPYFVMEYVEGQPLLDYCDGRRLSISERLKLFLDVCSAVQFAHQNLVVHRDLKPANILVTPDGTPKLLDFGIAKVLNPEMAAATLQQTASVLRLMTPDYASPEQVRGEPITTSSDVYSLGVLLYELLTGHRPYRLTSVDPVEALRVVCDRDPEKPSMAVTREEEIPAPDGTCSIAVTPESVSRTREGEPRLLQRRLKGDLDNIVLMAMRKEPKRRYASVEQLAEDIHRHLDGHPVIARKATLGYRTVKFVRRNRVAVAAAAIVLLSLLGGIGFSLQEAAVARRERARAQRRFNDVRRLAGSFLFEFHDAIENLPGSTPARALVVKRGLEYLDSLARESGGDPALRRELATAYQKVGDVQGRPTEANLGDTAGALASYRKALELREALAAADPKNTARAGELATCLDSVGSMLGDTGKKAAALAAHRRALAIRERLVAQDPKDPKTRKALAISYHFIGGLLSESDLEGAMEYRRKEMGIFESLWKEDPRSTNAQRNFALSLKYTGGNLERLGQEAGARELFARAIVLDEERSAADPRNTQARIDLSYSYGAMSSCLMNLGELDGALATYRKAFAIREALAEADPKNVNAREAVGRAYQKIGEILEEKGDAPAAAQSLRRSASIYEELAKADPSNQFKRALSATAWSKLAASEAKLALDPKVPAGKRGERCREARSLHQRSRDIFLDMRRRGTLPGSIVDDSEQVAALISRCEGGSAKR